MCLVPAATRRPGRGRRRAEHRPDGADEDGAVGLLVPGAGSTVTREGALSSLVRGKVVSSLLGGKATGKPLIRLSAGRRRAAITIYVTLPPPGRSHNTRRYPIAIVGGGYRGVLCRDTTRIPGLVSIADVAPTAVALDAGQDAADPLARARTRRDRDRSRDLDRRLRDAHDTRTAATIILVASTLVLAGLALLLRSRALSRGPACSRSRRRSSRRWRSPRAACRRPARPPSCSRSRPSSRARRRRARRSWLLPALLAFLVAELVVLAVWPDVNALSVIGPHPDGGGRYYGITNEVETLLLAPILAAASIAPRLALVAVAALSLVLVGWSDAGADGGGIVVVSSLSVRCGCCASGSG